MAKKKQLDLDVYLSNANSLKENIPHNHAERRAYNIYHPKVRGKSGGQNEPEKLHEGYLRSKQSFHEQEKQILITNQEVEAIFYKILCLPEAQKLWKAECLEIIQKKKQNLEQKPFAAFDKIISESMTETLTMFTNTLSYNPELDVKEEEKNENAEKLNWRSTQIQQVEMHRNGVQSFSNNRIVPSLPKSVPVHHSDISKKADPKPIHILIPNDFKKEFVLQIKDGKAMLLAQATDEDK